MYTSFTIENFRCFEQLTVEPLARVNLICGENNTGKTALPEALWLHSGPNSPDLGLRLNNFRGIAGPNPQRLLHDLFSYFDSQRTIAISAGAELRWWSAAARIILIMCEAIPYCWWKESTTPDFLQPS